MVTATNFRHAANDDLQGVSSPPTSGKPDTKGESTHPSVYPGTELVPYRTLERLMRTRASMSLRLQVIALWVLVVVGLLYLLQLSGYQRALTDIGNTQTVSIKGLGAAIHVEQVQVGGMAESLESVTSQMNTLTRDTRSIISVVDHQHSADGLATRHLEERVRVLEKTMASPPTVRLGPVSGQSGYRLARLADLPAKDAIDGVTASGNAIVARIVTPAASTPHQHTFDMSIPPIPGAFVHINAMRETDYWTILRPTPFNAMRVVRIMPFATTRTGVKVHCIDDGRDYTVTPAGDWF